MPDLTEQSIMKGRLGAAHARHSRSHGPIAIVSATLLMALQDAMVKLLSDDLPLWQFFFLRAVIILPVLAVAIGGRRRGMMRPAIAPWVLLRSLLIVAMYVSFYAALPVLELTLVSAVYYTGPLFIVLFTGLLLRDRVGISQGLAVLLAFAGVLIVLRPTGDGFSIAVLLPLLSALCYALSAVTTRGRTGRVDPWVLTLSLNLVFVVVGSLGMIGTALVDRPAWYPFLTTAWIPLGAREVGAVLLLAAISIGIHVLLARAYQSGPTAVVAGLDFSYLGFAAVWALIFFGTLPDWPIVLGTGLIAGAGLWGVRLGSLS